MRARVLERVRSPLADADLSLPDPVGDQVRVRVPFDPFDLADQGKRIVGCNYGSSVPAVDFPRLARLYLADRLPIERLVGRRAPAARGGRGPGRPARRGRPAHGAGAMKISPVAGRRSTDRGFRASRDVALCA